MENYSCERNIMLCLIRKAIHPNEEQTVHLDVECDAKKLETMIKRQSLVTMIYPVIMRQADDAWKPLKERLRSVYDREIHKGMVQEYEIQSLLDDMEKDGIDCLPMKGWIMRNYYPDPLMRSMGDLDVLIRDMDSQKMQKWMEARGYKAVRVQQQFHDEYQKPPCMYVELHHCLIDKACLQPSEIEWMNEITPTFWDSDNSIKKKKHIYQLTDELLYVHHISHFYKHFTGSGVGIRPMIDAYLFLKEKKQVLDWTIVERYLGDLHLLDFSKHIEQISLNCFGEKQTADEQTLIVIDYLLSSGIYGNAMTSETLKMMKDDEKVQKSNVTTRMIKRCFLPLNEMRKIYPCLQSCPVLLPFCWLIRTMRVVFLQRYKFKIIRCGQSEKACKKMEEVYSAVGITEHT